MLLSFTLRGRREKQLEHLEVEGTSGITFLSRRKMMFLKLNEVLDLFEKRMKMRPMMTGWTLLSNKLTRRMSIIAKPPRVIVTVNQRHGRKCK